MTQRLQGLVAAPFTPFDAQGNLALDRVADYAAMLARNGVVGAFIAGTTGESMSLTNDERKRLAEAWASEAPESFRVIVHVGHTCLRDCRELAAHAQQTGANGLGAMGPCFFRPATVDALVDWCAAIAQAAPELPFYYYHMPAMTGVDLPMGQFFAQARRRIGNFAGIKYTYEDLDEYRALLDAGDGRCDILFGRDEMLLSALERGATAAIGSTYNFAAPLYQQLIEAHRQGELDRARTLQDTACRMIRACQNTGGHALAAFKATMNVLGVDCGPVRPPLVDLNREQRDKLQRDLEALNLGDWCPQATN
jgi:N-acetylneuraminate lyase